jgi:nucleotide-binding universal stress UspA family protein
MNGILVGIDGSGQSARALEWAAREAAIRKLPLTVLTVSQAVAGYTGHAAMYGDESERTEQARRAAQEQTDKLLEQLDQASRPPAVTVKAVYDLPAQAILSAGADADMIVVGSRGAGGFRQLLLGSVSAQVVQHAHVPVVVIPAERG